MSALLEARQIEKAYVSGEPVLRGVSLSLNSGDFAALRGASGSGKSTLLHCLGLLDHFDRGELFFEGQTLSTLGEAERARFRLEKLGFVFQFHHLIPELNVIENVMLPSALLGKRDQKYARELIELVGLGGMEKRFPWQLSGGEQQRVALARALVNRAPLLLTDEATGNLDAERAEQIIDLLVRLNLELGTTVLSVTHDQNLAARYLKQFVLNSGETWDFTAK